MRETMSDRYDDNDSDTPNMAFVAGLCAGVVIGAGLALLFAPQRGEALRGQIADSASAVGQAVSSTFDSVTEAGRQVYTQAREFVTNAGEEVGRVTNAAAQGIEKGFAAARSAATSAESSVGQRRPEATPPA